MPKHAPTPPRSAIRSRKSPREQRRPTKMGADKEMGKTTWGVKVSSALKVQKTPT